MSAWLADLRWLDANVPWFFTVWAFVLGACLGSFYNVCIYRIPAGRSVVRPGSHCACGQPIAWYDNLPILSWLLRRGRARCCGRRFSVRYPLVEALTGALFALAWWHYPPLEAFALWVFLSLLVIATFIDLDHYEIPDFASIGGFVAGIGLSILVPTLHPAVTLTGPLGGFQALVLSLQGALLGAGLILWIAVLAEAVLKKEAMGFGDVKLMGAIGAFCGWQGAVFALFGGAVLGTVALPFVAVGYRLTTGQWPRLTAPEPAGDSTEAAPAPAPTDAETDRESAADDEDVPSGAVPFGPMLAAGAVVYLLFMRETVDAYFASLNALIFGP